MFDWIKTFLSGEVWLGFSKDEAVGTGVYRFTVSSSSLLGQLTKLFTIGKNYSYGKYSFDIKNINETADGKLLITANTTSAPQANEAGALGWGLILGGIGAALIFNSIEKIEKLVDTTTTRTIQIGIVLLLILIVWKFAKR